MKKHRNLKRLTISSETVRHLTSRETAEAAGATVGNSCNGSCLDFITCGCQPTGIQECGGPTGPLRC